MTLKCAIFSMVVFFLSLSGCKSVCGNGVTNQGEECDDENLIEGDGCDSNCTVSACGNGIVGGEEECEDGNQENTDGCLSSCELATCNDGFVQAAQEECDDGNNVGGDGCRGDCLGLEECGDGQLDIAIQEECDDGNNVGGDGCRGDCLGLEECGDGFLDTVAGERCDDGNLFNGDGCRFDCTLELCGDSIVDPQEDCDDGNLVDFDGCGATCLLSVSQLAASFNHTCVLLNSGTVRCWGLGDNGRLGYGNTNSVGDNETPLEAYALLPNNGDVNVGGSVVQLTAGGNHTCALLSSGTVRCWGNSSAGQLGYGNTNFIGDNESPASAGDVVVF
jgi:cysteine-rich repeat protein